MKNVVVVNNKFDLIKARFLTFLIIIIGIFLCSSSLKTSIEATKDSYYHTKEVSDISITIEDGNSYYTLIVGESKYYFNGTDKLSANYETDYAGKDATIIIDDSNNLYGLEIDEVKIVDLVETYKKSAKSSIIFSAVIIAVCVGYGAFTLVKILTKKKEETFEYVEYVMEHNNVTSIEMFKNNAYTKKYASIYQKCLYGVLALEFIGILLISSFKGWFKGTSLIVMYVATGIVLIGVLVLLYVFRPQFQSKQLDKYLSDYKDYLENGGNPKYNDHFFEFKKEGLKINLKDNPLFLDYHDLNLYTTVVYSKGAHCANIFICSDMDESKLSEINASCKINPVEEVVEDVKETEEIDETLEVETGKKMPAKQEEKQEETKQELERDFIIILSDIAYQEIMANGIFIRGLDYVMENLKVETIKNTTNLKKRIKVVKYQD